MLCSGSLSADGEYLLEYHENIGELNIAESRSSSAGPTVTTTLSMHAFGQDLLLELEPNVELLSSMAVDENAANASTLAARETLGVFRGRLRGVDGSWARLTRSDNSFSGVVWDGERLLALEPFEEVRAMIPNGDFDADTTGHVMYDTDDLIAMDGQSCAVENGAASAREIGGEGRLLDKPGQVRASAAVGGQLNVAFVVDEQFARDNGQDIDGAIVARLNIIDGIYSKQVGVRISPTGITRAGNGAGLTSSNASQLLGQFSSYARSQVPNPGLVHLFTGRDLDGGVAGIAFLNVLCSTQRGHAVTQSTRSMSTVTSSLIAAHEIGHNFGAPHDGQRGSSCAATPRNFLMSPSLNGSSTFSSCGLDRMGSAIANASCIVPVTDPQPPAQPPAPAPAPQPPTSTPTPVPQPDSLIFAANFNNGSSQRFSFGNDPWGLGSAPDYQSAALRSSGGASGGAIGIRLGGIDDREIVGMSGGIRRSFDTRSTSDLRISFKVNLVQTSEYEQDERSDVYASFDGKILDGGPLATVTGNGNGGGIRSTGFRTYRFDLAAVPAGRHEIVIGGTNSKKTESSEITEILVDDVRVRSRNGTGTPSARRDDVIPALTFMSRFRTGG